MSSGRWLGVLAIAAATAAAGCGTVQAGGTASVAAGVAAAQSPVSVATAIVPAKSARGSSAATAKATKTPHGRSTTSASASPTQSTATPSPTPTVPAGPVQWKLVFATDFNGTSLPSPWYAYNDPNGATPRTLQSVQVTNGMLELIGHNQSPYGWVGGGVADGVDQTYGRWEVRFRGEVSSGYDPVVLLWPHGTWPTDGEIDVAEVTGANRQGGWENLHIGPANQVMRNEIPSSVDFTQWHTMAVDWLPDHITMWLDGKAIWTVAASTGFVPTTPFHMALQLDQGCGGNCHTDSQTQQNIMYVDWVRIYAPA